MDIIKLKPLSVCATNSYIVAGKQGNAVLVDAPDNAEYILSELDSRKLKLKKILLLSFYLFLHSGIFLA